MNEEIIVMDDNNNLAPGPMSARGLFALSKAIQGHKDAQQANKPGSASSDAIEAKIKQLTETGVMNKEADAINSGISGLVLTGDVMNIDSYLNNLSVNSSKYPTIMLTEDEVKVVSADMKRMSAGVNAVVPMKCTGDACAFKSTCVTGDTMVLIHGGRLMKIEDMVIPRNVVSFNIDEQREEKDMSYPVRVLPKPKTVYRITTNYGHQLKCTIDHYLYAQEAGRDNWHWTSIETGLSVGDKLVVTYGMPNDKLDDFIEYAESYGDLFVAEITSIECLPRKERVYDITVMVNSNFFANGILVHNCPYYAVGKAPVGQPCIVETQLVHYWTQKYLEEFEVSHARLTEIHLVGELAEFDIYEMRATKLLAEKYPTMMQEIFIGFDSDGNAISNEDISRVFELKERIKKSRLKILETLMATRKERAKAVINAVAAESSTLSALKDKIESISRDIGGLNNRGKGKYINPKVDAEIIDV